ncbi:hypothetical protein HDU67_002364 [Dinochytrium kinnereticum]|nr:hypothetical protein HDU67_002364 [Dinochytrium kinnereticum]
MDSKLNVEWARSRFPAIANNDPKSSFTYMDNAGGSAVLDTVINKIGEYLSLTNVQLTNLVTESLHQGASYRISQESTTLVKLGNEAGRMFINAEHLDEIVMGSSTTQLIENLARAMEPGLKRYHEIIISNTDHEANVGPMVRMAKRRGLKLKVWQVNKKTLELDIADLKKLLTKNTRLVAMTHCSNILGTVNDISAIANAESTIISVDGVAYAPHKSIDVQVLNVDFYVFSWYKVFGPHISMLYTRRSAAARLSSLAHFFIHATERPYTFQPGGQNYELSASLPYILAYVAEAGRGFPLTLSMEGTESQRVTNLLGSLSYNDIAAGYEKFSAHEEKLSSILLEYLASRKDVYRVIGRPQPGPDRVPTIAFLVKGMKSEDVVLKVDKHNIAHRLIVGSLGLDERDGVVRVSLAHYNTEEEVRRLTGLLDDIVGTQLPSSKL